MKYPYEDLAPEQFEELIVLLCQKLLGISTQGFANGPDGGRDAKFVGTAELHPSRTAPWKGITIIQAKHTNGYNKHFSETDFFSTASDNTTIGHELPRILNLRKKRQLDNYMLFANRRLTGNAESEIRQHISLRCDIPEESIYLCGTQQLELFLKHFPDIAKKANFDPIDSPLLVSSDELSEVIQAFSQHKSVFSEIAQLPPVPRISYKEKNLLNSMTPEYAKVLCRRYLKETTQIDNFLSSPENYDILNCYLSVVEEFQLQIISKRKNYQTFDEIMEYITRLLFARDPILNQRNNKRLTKAMLFYMYWNCDIGKNEHVETN
jgi:hypothetical protein